MCIRDSPLGFDISEKQVRRAGLDYWSELDLSEYQSFEEVREKHPSGRFFYCTTKGLSLIHIWKN